MLKQKISLILIILTLSIPILAQKSNILFGMTITNNNPKYSQDIRFINPKKIILPELIKIFGKDFIKQGDIYEWTNVKVKGLCMCRLNVRIEHIRYDYEKPYYGIVVDEKFIVTITRKNKDFLNELKFWNIYRLRKIFKQFSEPLIYS
jgi:hypothetical protein